MTTEKKNTVQYDETLGKPRYTRNFGRIDYSQFSWLSGEYDPDNIYPSDPYGIEYVKNFQSLDEKNIWFIRAFTERFLFDEKKIHTL